MTLAVQNNGLPFLPNEITNKIFFNYEIFLTIIFQINKKSYFDVLNILKTKKIDYLTCRINLLHEKIPSFSLDITSLNECADLTQLHFTFKKLESSLMHLMKNLELNVLKDLKTSEALIELVKTAVQKKFENVGKTRELWRELLLNQFTDEALEVGGAMYPMED